MVFGAEEARRLSPGPSLFSDADAHTKTHTRLRWLTYLSGLLCAGVLALMIVVLLRLLPWINQVKNEVRHLRHRVDHDIGRFETLEDRIEAMRKSLDTIIAYLQQHIPPSSVVKK